MATEIQWTAHRDDEKVGAHEVLEDHEAARMIDTGVARLASEPMGEFGTSSVASQPEGTAKVVVTGEPVNTGSAEGDTDDATGDTDDATDDTPAADREGRGPGDAGTPAARTRAPRGGSAK